MKKFNVSFNDLSEKAQKNMLLSDNSKQTLELALYSEYPNIRRYALEQNEVTSEMLNNFLYSETEKTQEEYELVFYHPNFEKNEQNLEILAFCDIPKIQARVAKLTTSTDLLSSMTSIDNEDVIENIITNPNYQKDTTDLYTLSKSSSWRVRMIPAEDPETPIDTLSIWLLEEYSDEVFSAILRNLRLRNVQISVPETCFWREEIIKKIIKTEKSPENLKLTLNSQLKQGKNMNLQIIEEVFKNPYLEETESIKLKKKLLEILNRFHNKSATLQATYSALLELFNVL